MERSVIYVLIIAALLVTVFGQEWLQGYFECLTPAP